MNHYSNLSDLHKAYGYPPPENPLISVLCDVERPADFGDHIPEHTSEFYVICFKKMISGSIKYGFGKTKYDLFQRHYVLPASQTDFGVKRC